MSAQFQPSTFRILLAVPRQARVEGRVLPREEFFAWAWERFGEKGLLGVHEGTLLSEEAASEGLETDSWTLDAGEAPRERDWVAGRELAEGELYFGTEPEAREAWQEIERAAPEVKLRSVDELEHQDWDAQWKASFLNAAEGVSIAPFWRILPPWVTAEEAKLKPGEQILKINPGAGFGTGTHETTQLCLAAIGEAARAVSVSQLLSGKRVLDFGSGSGILSIGAALLGARVDGVEIDPLAIDNATENARLNGVESKIEYSRSLGGAPGAYELVIANILRPVLLEFAPELVKRIAPGGTLILSGLIESDVASVTGRYSELLGGRKPRVGERAEWRSLVWMCA